MRLAKHFAGLLAFVAVVAQGQGLPPWSWPLSDRIKTRLDAAEIARRASVNASEFKKTPRAKAPRFVVNGQHNPELFLPSELMAYLLSMFGADVKTGRTIRDSYRPWLTYFGWNPDSFWRDFELAARPYIDQQNSSFNTLTEDDNKKMCASRAAALATMRRDYQRFDEFLYRAVAPRHSVASDEMLTADWLLLLEGGCR